jgi:hypothetical protein
MHRSGAIKLVRIGIGITEKLVELMASATAAINRT